MEREQFKNYLEILLFDDYNLFSYLSQDDIAILKLVGQKNILLMMPMMKLLHFGY